MIKRSILEEIEEMSSEYPGHRIPSGSVPEVVLGSVTLDPTEDGGVAEEA